MAVPFSNTKLRVPKGFQNILEGLAREVLRNQPENPFEFGAKYFEQLLKVREETGHDPAVHGARLEDRFYNNDSFKSPSVDPSSPQQQEAALKIQTNYRKHDAEQKVAEMKEEEAAEKIQAGFRGFQDRQKYEEIKGDEKKDEEEEVDIDLNDPDVEKAAVKIQAGFKGFKARQEIKDLKESKQTSEKTEEKKAEEEEVDIDLKDPDVEKAALKIQAGFKGMQARQEIKAMKDAKESEKREETQEETVDIDLKDPETEKAALKIQAGFKGYQTRKEIKAKKDEKAEETKEATEEKTEEKSEEKKEDVDIDLNDPEVEKAATKIQAGFKGFKTRQEIKAKQESGTDAKEGEETEKTEDKTEETKPAENTEGENIDIDLNDPEVAQAATKIQAGFKGFKTRQEMKAKKAEENKDDGE